MYVIIFYSVVELRENVDYQVEFQAGESRMAIMVSLSPNFPLEKPVLRVSPPISHPWCNEHSEITSAPGLLNVSIVILFSSIVIFFLYLIHIYIYFLSHFYFEKYNNYFAMFASVFSTQ